MFGSKFDLLPARVLIANPRVRERDIDRQDRAKSAEFRLLTILIDYFLMSEGRAAA